MKHSNNDYDLIVVGGGHAGVEAALVGARLGVSTALVSHDKKALARMSCNPAIGGLAKGQIVRELDVLGGVMGIAADSSGLQFKLLNKSKGRSVWSPRAQTDKRAYEQYIIKFVENQQNLKVLEGEAVKVLERGGKIYGVQLRGGEVLECSTLIITTGTFLNGVLHIGNRKIPAGRMGEPSSLGVTESLVAHGFKSGRLKTGTPPRILKNTVEWEKLTIVHGDKTPVPFSYRTKNFNPPNIACHTAKTNSACHDIIFNDIDRSPLFAGDIFGEGPRYCPSIEDKIHRFSHHGSHILFLEPEWRDSDQIYVNGFSTSLPEDTQIKAIRRVHGLGSVEFLRPGYAIEYDFFPPAQLKATLESKLIGGLFFAGQVNGTSGYEEAAAQGLLAGINAVRSVFGKEPFMLGRNEAYIGVLIDDLITKDTFEPYRMFTSRAEYRLILRYSNADRRLAKKAFDHNLIADSYYQFLSDKITLTNAIINNLKESVRPAEINTALGALDEAAISQPQPAQQILKRPGMRISMLPNRFAGAVNFDNYEEHIVDEMLTEAETSIKYAGYIARQHEHVERIKSQEKIKIPKDIDYLNIGSLSNEAREKLDFVRPETLGQAMRVSGVSPADISVLSVLIYSSK